MPDVEVTNHGSIVLVAFLTPDAQEWAAIHVPEDGDHMYYNGALVVEPRYFENLLEGMTEAGLVVK